MDINNFVKNNCYKKDSVWFLDGHTFFNYSDGSREEKYVYNVIVNAHDISVMSRELETHIRNWVSRYHLSRERSLAYWPLAITKEMTILEVGSGCGAITRFLGEQAKTVLALEGSPMRAAITSARVRDLNNVEVLCAPFQDVNFSMKFDVIIFNGVFEYSATFVGGEKPYDLILDKSKELLEPDGTLCIAIENQFGLRYFSSSREDHTNVMFDGIEGYPRFKRGVHTFGYKQLREMLSKRFKQVELLLPLPDYKLPKAVVRETLSDSASCAELFAVKSNFDHGVAQRPYFHEGLAWCEIEKNGLLSHMANSFFFVACNVSSSLLPKDWLGSIYAINRKPRYTTVANIIQGSTGDLIVQKKNLELDFDDECPFVTQRLTSDSWENGQSLHTMLAKSMCEQKKISLEGRFNEVVRLWWNHVEHIQTGNGSLLDPDSIDLVWQNTYLCQDEIHLIDQEWRWNDGVYPEWLIVRTVSNFLKLEWPYVHRWAKAVRFVNQWTMMRTVATICKKTFTFRSFLRVIESENEFQESVKGISLNKWRIVLAAFLPMQIRQYIEFGWRRYLNIRDKSIIRWLKRKVKGIK